MLGFSVQLLLVVHCKRILSLHDYFHGHQAKVRHTECSVDFLPYIVCHNFKSRECSAVTRVEIGGLWTKCAAYEHVLTASKRWALRTVSTCQPGTICACSTMPRHNRGNWAFCTATPKSTWSTTQGCQYIRLAFLFGPVFAKRNWDSPVVQS